MPSNHKMRAGHAEDAGQDLYDLRRRKAFWRKVRRDAFHVVLAYALSFVFVLAYLGWI